MCDQVDITHNSIREDGACLCCSTQEEIIKFIVEQLKPQDGETILIGKTVFGWTAEKTRTENKQCQT